MLCISACVWSVAKYQQCRFHMHSCFSGLFQGPPWLVICPHDVQSPVILILSIMIGQATEAKTCLTTNSIKTLNVTVIVAAEHAQIGTSCCHELLLLWASNELMAVLVVQRFGVGLVIERSLVRLLAGALSSQLGQLSLPFLCMAGVRQGAFTCVR